MLLGAYLLPTLELIIEDEVHFLRVCKKYEDLRVERSPEFNLMLNNNVKGCITSVIPFAPCNTLCTRCVYSVLQGLPSPLGDTQTEINKGDHFRWGRPRLIY